MNFCALSITKKHIDLINILQKKRASPLQVWCLVWIARCNITRSHNYKEEKYAPLIADLSRTYKTYHFSVEVSVRGQISRHNKQRLKALTYRVCSDPKAVFKPMIQVLSKSALLSSFSIFSARAEPSWNNPPYLVTNWLHFLYCYYVYVPPHPIPL